MKITREHAARDQLFEEFVAWSREERATSDPYQRVAIEYLKASSEFYKLALTNLHLINAGGLLATPTLANFVGFNTASPLDRSFLIGAPVGLFTLGLIAAIACALLTYFHLASLARKTLAREERDILDSEKFVPLLRSETRSVARDSEIPRLDKIVKKLGRMATAAYVFALGFGALSVGCFICACAFMALNMR